MSRVPHQIPVPSAYGDPENERIWCAWADCEDPASSLHTMTECFNRRRAGHGQRPRRPMCPGCRRVAFCSAAHMDYYAHSHEQWGGRSRWGMLSAGESPKYL